MRRPGFLFQIPSFQVFNGEAGSASSLQQSRIPSALYFAVASFETAFQVEVVWPRRRVWDMGTCGQR